MKMTNAKIAEFRNDFRAAMKALETKYGVTVDMGNCKYSSDVMTFTNLKVTNVSDSGEKAVNPRSEFYAKIAMGAHLLKSGFSKAEVQEIVDVGVIGKTWVLNDGRRIKITDWNTRAPKYAVIFECDGQGYRCSVSAINGRA